MKLISLISILLFFCYNITPQNIDIKHYKHKLQCKHKGINRCIVYEITSDEIPPMFDGFNIAFITDTHYKSKFTEQTLKSLQNILLEIKADLICLGGDYQESCEYVDPLFSSINSCHAPQGAFGVLGNNDYERCTDVIRHSMKENNIKLLENSADTVWYNGQYIIIAGAQNTFTNPEKIASPTLQYKDSDFVILLTHTPDYVEDIDISNTDIALAGHTHGGQVTLFGLFAPATNSHYGQKFVKGLKYNSGKIPIIISNGIGTSRKNIRFCARSEIIVLKLHLKK